MLTFDSTTRNALRVVTTKTDWVQTLYAALGDTRRIRAFQDGVEFRNVGSTGPFTTVSGNITKLGTINNTTISLPADMSIGSSTLRIEGNGCFVEGTLGLSRAAQIAKGISAAQVVDYDFVVERNFTSTNGIAVQPNFFMGANKFLSSGVGPQAPQVTDDAPASFEVWNWVNPASPVLVGTISLNHRFDNFVYEDHDLAVENGDSVVLGSTQMVQHGDIKFAAIVTISDQSNTEVGNVPLYGALVTQSFDTTKWPLYPSKTGYDKMNHVLNPDPFKIVMKNGKGDTLYIFQMHDGLPINDPSMHNARTGFARDETHELRPSYNVAMALIWHNVMPKTSSIIRKIYPGFRTEYIRPSTAKTHISVTSVEPLITGGYQGNSLNSLGNLYATDQWPRPYSAYNPDISDPFVPITNQFNRSGSSSMYSPWSEGWGYEPGSYSTHNWYTSPGGPRFDRSTIPSHLALYITYPTGTRAQNLVPYKQIAHNFCMAYANHSNHFYSDPRRLFMDTNDRVINGQWGYDGTYYGGWPAPNYILLNANQRDGDNASNRDKNGNMVLNGWGRDPLHAYGHAGWGALVFNSTIYALLGKADTVTEFMNSGSPDRTVIDSYYMVRTMAWEFLAMTMAWKTASNHEMGFTKKEMESRMARLLQALYRDIYVPAYITQVDSLYFNSMRNLGCPMKIGNTGAAGTLGGGLGYYMGHVLQFMKQSGMWSVMYAQGGNVATMMKCMIDHFDLYNFGVILDTPWLAGPYQGYSPGTDPVPTSWSDYAAKYENTGGDLHHDAQGNWISDREVGTHPMEMYPYIRRDYFPEFPNPRIDQAIAKLEAYEAGVRARLAQFSATDYDNLRDNDVTWRYPSLAPIAPPADGDLGPA